MLYAATLVAPEDAVFLPETVVAAAVESLGAKVIGRHILADKALDLAIEAPEGLLAELRAAAEASVAHFPLDICVQPWDGRKKRLLVADMDSTIIGCEC